MERNKLYTVTKASSDDVIRLGDLIWLSEDDTLNSIMYMGTCLRKNWDVPGQNDFQVEPCEKFHLGDCHGVPIPLRNRNYIVAKMTDYIRNMINSLAEDILDIYKIGFRVDDINDLVQKLGGSIQMKKDFSYASLEKNGDGFKIIVSSYQDEQRKRFAIAQELGHLFLHMGYKTNAEIWEKQADKVPFQEKDPEKVRQANEFAAALLMPRYIFFLTLEAASDIAESGKRTIHMQAVADFFNVSLSAAYTRAKDFGII